MGLIKSIKMSKQKKVSNSQGKCSLKYMEDMILKVSDKFTYFSFIHK